MSRSTTNGAPLTGAPACPKCGGRMWDNRAEKAAGTRSPKAPDFKCRNPQCDGQLWPGQHSAALPIVTQRSSQDVTRADAASHVATSRVGQESARPELTAQEARRERLRRCYLELTDFVLADVRSRYEAAGVPCNCETVAAIAATLFIATCRGSGA